MINQYVDTNANAINKDIAHHRYLILHGGWQTARLWESVQAELNRRGHLCWVPDLTVNLEHDPTGAAVPLESLAAFVLDRIHHDPLMRDLVLVAHSIAGPVAQLVAAAAADLIQAVVFADAWVLDHEWDQPERLVDLLPFELAQLRVLAEDNLPVVMTRTTWRTMFTPEIPDEAEPERWCPCGWLTSSADLRPLLERPIRATQALVCGMPAPHPGLGDVAVPVDRQLQPDAQATVPGGHHAFQAHPIAFTEELARLGEQARSARGHPRDHDDQG